MNLSKVAIEQSKKKFLVKSKDPFLVEHFLDQLKGLLPEKPYFSCSDIESFAELCSSGSLFSSDGRIIVLSEFEKDDLDDLVNLTAVEAEDILVLVECAPLLKSKAYTLLKSLCTFIELKEPSESERAAWVKKWLTAEGLSFEDDVPGYIVNRSGEDLSCLRNEAHKISLLLSDASSKIVTKDICDKLVASNRESQYFVFMENFFRKKFSEVITEFKKVDEASYIKLLHFMIGQIEKQVKIAIFKEQGLTPEQISEIIGVPAFIVKTKLFTVLSFYGKMKLLMLLDLLNKLDVELRLTKYPKSLLFESYLVKAFKL